MRHCRTGGSAVGAAARARVVPVARRLRATLQGTPSGLNPVPTNVPPEDTQDCAMGNKEQPNPDAAVVDLTTTAEDASSAANPVEERLSETTLRTPSISGSNTSRRDRLVNQARLERLHEEKHRFDKEHKHILERLVELDTKRRLLEIGAERCKNNECCVWVVYNSVSCWTSYLALLGLSSFSQVLSWVANDKLLLSLKSSIWWFWVASHWIKWLIVLLLISFWWFSLAVSFLIVLIVNFEHFSCLIHPLPVLWLKELG